MDDIGEFKIIGETQKKIQEWEGKVRCDLNQNR